MELVAPGGDLNKSKYALNYGADAVYLGIPDYSLRVRVNKFTPEDLKKGIRYAHKNNKKVYITLNIYPHNRQLEKLKEHLKGIVKFKPDGIIVSDPGVVYHIKKTYPGINIHLSTQANALNYGAVEFWKKQGIKRIVLARETTLKEIEEIKNKVKGIELEYFVHGAMCMAYSGRCLLSAWLNKRSANEGDCTQPCRWPYIKTEQILRSEELEAKNEKERKNSLVIEEAGGETYIFNSKDLCLIKHLDKIEKAGIDALKIEGRNKSLYYLATTVKYYRKVIDAKEELRDKLVREALKEFSKLGNRQYTTGFALDMDKDIQNFNDSRNYSQYEMVGEVRGQEIESNKKTKEFKYSIKVHNAIREGKAIDAISPQNLKKVKVLKIFNHNQEEKKSAHGGDDKLWYIVFDRPLEEWTILRKQKDS